MCLREEEDEEEKEEFIWNHGSSERSDDKAWNRDVKMSEKRGIPFYFNFKRRITTWTRPIAADRQ